MNDKLINELISLGLTEYEAKVYITLVTRGPLTGSDISKFAKIPKTKVYDIVKNLGLKTIIEESLENGNKKFKSVEPEHAISKIIEKKEEEVSRTKSMGAEIIKQIEKSKVPFDNKKCIWLSEGKKEFLERSAMMVKNAKKYAYGITKEFSRTSVLDDEIVKAAKRGIDVKGIGLGKLKDLSESRAKWYASNNVELRMVELDIQPRVCIVDDKEVCMRIDAEDSSEFIWTDNPAMINFVRSYFMVLWQSAKKYE